MSDHAPPTPPPLRRTLPRILVRVAVLLAFVVLVHQATMAVLDWLETLPAEAQGPMRTRLMIAALVVYALLIAVPFVPGVEIGLSILVLYGAEVALPVYLATVIGLSGAFVVGCMVPLSALRRLFLDLHLPRACHWIDEMSARDGDERRALLRAGLPVWAQKLAVDWRYVTLALLINLPGNVVLGGGGGLSMAAGISGLFRPIGAMLTLALAVAPLPLAVAFFGVDGVAQWLH